jgi:hypothetical protein
LTGKRAAIIKDVFMLCHAPAPAALGLQGKEE